MSAIYVILINHGTLKSNSERNTKGSKLSSFLFYFEIDFVQISHIGPFHNHPQHHMSRGPLVDINLRHRSMAEVLSSIAILILPSHYTIAICYIRVGLPDGKFKSGE